MSEPNPDYNNLYNRPSINGVVLSGNHTHEELGFPDVETMTDEEIDAALGWS